jgi:hypothetical protein
MEQIFKLSNSRTLKIEIDDIGVENPRSWNNLGKVILFESRKHLGDDHKLRATDYTSWEENKKAVCKAYNVAVIKPIYMYSHSGETIATTPFSCPWDSYQIGWILITKESLRENFSIKRITQSLKIIGETIMEGEIKTLNYFISGEVYGFTIEDENGNKEDNMCGFYGSDIKTNGILDYISEQDRLLVLEQV